MTIAKTAVDSFLNSAVDSFGELGGSEGGGFILHPNELAVMIAADSASYSGSGQVWADISGNGNELHLGDDASTDGTDPLFGGTAGTDSAYWYTDVNDSRHFTEKTLPQVVNEAYKTSSNITVIAAIKNPSSNDFWDSLCAGTPSTSSSGYRGVRVLHALGSGYIRVIHMAGSNQEFLQLNVASGEMGNTGNLLTIVNLDMTTLDMTMYANGNKYTGTLPTGNEDDATDSGGFSALVGATRQANGSTYGEMPANGFEMYGWAVIDGSVSDAEAAVIKTNIEALTGKTF